MDLVSPANWPALSAAARNRLQTRLTPRQADFADVHLPPLPDVPGMISPAEERYLYWLTSQGYTGSGAVVEVGTWLGRSTTRLAAGLRDAGFHEVLDCYDRYVWKADHRSKSAVALKPGGDFQPVFLQNVRPVYPAVRSVKADLGEIVWNGGPIELLFLDAPKKVGAVSHALSAFGPHLVPGLSTIVLQDYLHFPAYALAAVCERLGGRVGLLHAIERGTTVSFHVKQPLDFGRCQPRDWNPASWTRREAHENWQRVLAPLNPASRSLLEPGLAVLLFDIGERDEACRLLQQMAFTPEMTAFWRQLARTSYYHHYRPLFLSRGIRSTWRREIHAVLRGPRRKAAALVKQCLGRIARNNRAA